MYLGEEMCHFGVYLSRMSDEGKETYCTFWKYSNLVHLEHCVSTEEDECIFSTVPSRMSEFNLAPTRSTASQGRRIVI